MGRRSPWGWAVFSCSGVGCFGAPLICIAIAAWLSVYRPTAYVLLVPHARRGGCSQSCESRVCVGGHAVTSRRVLYESFFFFVPFVCGAHRTRLEAQVFTFETKSSTRSVNSVSRRGEAVSRDVPSALAAQGLRSEFPTRRPFMTSRRRRSRWCPARRRPTDRRPSRPARAPLQPWKPTGKECLIFK